MKKFQNPRKRRNRKMIIGTRDENKMLCFVDAALGVFVERKTAPATGCYKGRWIRCWFKAVPNTRYLAWQHERNRFSVSSWKRWKPCSSGSLSTTMGLFGLGWPEIAVIVVVGTLIFGPKKISELGKDLGKVVGSMKQATSEFSEGMEESLKEAEEKRRKEQSEEPNKVQTIRPSLKEQIYDVQWEKAEKDK